MPASGAAHCGGMEIIVEIYKGKDGRPVGRVRGADKAQGRAFSGNLEFLALVEDLYLAETIDDQPERTEQ